MAFTAVVALAAGETTVTAALVLSAVAEVGTALTVVGALTGSKDLMKIGGVMGLVGGIGGVIAGASGAAATAGADAAASAGTDAAVDAAGREALDQYGGEAAMQASQQAGIQSMEQGATQGIVGSEVASAVAPITQTAPVTQSVANATNIQPVAQVQPAAQTDVIGASAPTGANAPVGAQGPAEISTPYDNPTDMRLANGSQTTPGGPSLSSDSLFSKFSNWANQNKTLVTAGTQLVGGAMKGMADQSNFDQQMALKNAYFNRANSVGTFAPQTIPATGIIGRAA